MNSIQRKRWFGLVLVFFVCIIGTSTPIQHLAAFPDELRLFSGQPKRLDYGVPVHAKITVDPAMLQVNGSTTRSTSVNLNQPLSLQSSKAGMTEMSLKLFGKIPFKTVKVNVVPDLHVIPGGQTIGVKVKAAGIMVVGHHLVKGEDGKKVSPGENADIHLGDLITKVDGVAMNDVHKLASVIEQSGESKRPLQLSIKRSGKMIGRQLMPAFDAEDKSWRLGLYIRDSAAGVGTLTFYAPDQGVYGALGHVITDMDTQQPIEVGEGQILQSNVRSINKSQNGEPGEKRAEFVKQSKILGNIKRNTPFGIFGGMTDQPDHGYDNRRVPVAFAEEVKEGPAEIWTVIDGQKVERFHIEIVHVTKQSVPATKGMVIRITDKRLLERTGGIVQGMSGSPILQNGKLVGAVTHVFVNDPTSGYGCFIEWMLQDAGVLLKSAKQNLEAV
ncbi:stage IV sporulation protein B [Paenibacillus cellulosilyticus]|uniref:Stage IV sporulation protein B n=1 Tax=Paenibacillus cellulosilyticus TaxID=375489 RepID=A0A2V2YWA1_9BACL|nr:SpoIVB peptidase [Paenibacillus cellulosilyticus]PWW05641.1 stage IV sporulation protein B [Paenibacillus cellulosilyticus]QKS46550.1 SpoIVB peptidase [Paenibacillus cellulosilyticus]